MLVLALSVCLAQSPETCKQVQLTFDADSATPSQCMRYGQPEIAKWNVLHPEWTVKKWRCVPADQVPRNI